MDRGRRVVAVVWEDAHAGEDAGWHRFQPKKHHKARKILSAGIVVKDTKKGLTLTLNYDRYAQNVADTIFIPRSGILEVTDVTPR